MKEKNFGGFLLTVIIVGLLLFCVYLCVDFFKIVDIPEKYSIVRWIEDKFDIEIENIDTQGEDISSDIKKKK